MTLLPDSCDTRRLLCIVLLFLVVILGLVTYTVYKAVEDSDGKTLKFAETKNDVLRFYGDFFKKPSEQKEYETKFFSNTNNTVDAERKTSKLSRYYADLCSRYTQPPQPDENRGTGRGKRSAGSDDIQSWVYHGCCSSYRHFTSPETAISDQTHQEVDLVHFSTDRQYFLEDVCWHDSSCAVRCGCQVQVGLHRALIHNPRYNSKSNSAHHEDTHPYLVQMIRLGGSCKCMNNLAPTTFG